MHPGPPVAGCATLLLVLGILPAPFGSAVTMTPGVDVGTTWYLSISWTRP